MNKSDKQEGVPKWFLHQAFKDPDFLNDLHESVLGESKPRGYFKDKYLIPDAVIHNTFVVDHESAPDDTGIFDITDEEYTINLRISKKITKQEYLNGWKLIQWYKKNRLDLSGSDTKRKSPVYPELIYAVFKARHRAVRLTFKQIFDLYMKGELPYYTKSTRPFSTEESLERYYRRYSPKP